MQIIFSGSVTMEDVLSVLPYENGVVRLKLQGIYLKEALEVSVKQYDKSGVEAPGKYLQVSGLFRYMGNWCVILNHCNLLILKKLSSTLYTQCLF
jgi:predicted RNA-binding protein